MVILSCALWSNWMPFWSGMSRLSYIAAVSFALAPAPNVLFGGLAGADSFSDYNKCVIPSSLTYSAYLDFGYFLTGLLLMTGVALPLMLAHTSIITGTAALLSLGGGVLIYGTSTYAKVLTMQ